MKIAIDAMGGDNAPAEIVKGCVEASINLDAELILVGQADKISEELDKYKTRYNPDRIKIKHAPDVIENDDSPVKAVRSKPQSSLVMAVDMVKNHEADTVLSAGNTGALMTASLLHLGRIKGIDRPAIVSIYPLIGKEDGFSLLVDAGANAECKPEHLVGFGYMGSIYMHNAFGKENPTVGLINIGAEETKGTPMLKATYKLLEASDLNFIGNVEGRDIPSGPADVYVCDGFTGNIVLKLTEGVAWSVLKAVKKKLMEDIVAKVGGLLVKSKFNDLRKKFDYSTYGGAPILGVSGLVFKMHGSSGARAVENAIMKAAVVASGNVVEEIEAAMSRFSKGNDSEDAEA